MHVAVTLHEGTTFLVSGDDGDFEPESDGGLYHLDTRFLSRHTLRLDGKPPVLLQPSTPAAGEARHFFTNPPLDGAGASTLSLLLHRELGEGLRETVEVESFAGAEAHLELELSLDGDFEYILTVKQRAVRLSAGERWTPRVRREVVDGRELKLELEDAETPHRTAVRFDRTPDHLDERGARFRLALAPRERWALRVEIAPSIGATPLRPAPPSRQRRQELDDRHRALAGQLPTAESDHPVLAPAFAQAARDLAALRIQAEVGGGGGGEYAIAAGIPWYMDLFGRDSLIASYEAMLADAALARGTLDALARLQGREVDRRSEEAPGKILHEYRRGPLTPAARKIMPSYPYYGTIDATPLFLVTLSEYVRATGDLAFARARWDHVRAALEWMRRYGDRDGDGLLEYQRDGDVGLVNQGWKDSVDSVRFRDGRLAAPPIALVEVQGYAVEARRRTAALARQLGDGAEADRLEGEAAALRDALQARFWLPERRTFAEALDGQKHPVDSLTSNPGHLLWMGAVDAAHARAVADALLSDDMYSGYGVRTMGAREGGFNPVSYHDGSVWPHDNALFLAGLVRYGLREHAARLAAGLLDALGRFPRLQPPELFCGYPAAEYGIPVRYPTACRPQAWASGAVLLLLRSVLGLEVDAGTREVVVSPLPLPGMTRLSLRRVPVDGARVDVQVRVQGGEATAEVSGLPAGWRRVEPAEYWSRH